MKVENGEQEKQGGQGGENEVGWDSVENIGGNEWQSVFQVRP